jgi:hypothetical protein
MENDGLEYIFLRYWSDGGGRFDTEDQVQVHLGQIYISFFVSLIWLKKCKNNRQKLSEIAAIINIINCYTLTMFIIYTYVLETNVEMKQLFP